jgi:hypothetical protein
MPSADDRTVPPVQSDAQATPCTEPSLGIAAAEEAKSSAKIAHGTKKLGFISSVEAGYRASILLTIVSTAHWHKLVCRKGLCLT